MLKKILLVMALPLFQAAIVVGFVTGKRWLIWGGVAGVAALLVFMIVAALVVGSRYVHHVIRNWATFNTPAKWLHALTATLIATGLAIVLAATATLIIIQIAW